MSVIDIRNKQHEKIVRITFSDNLQNSNAYNIRLVKNVWITSENGEVCIKNQQDAENLIKALQKAIELGWWKE